MRLITRRLAAGILLFLAIMFAGHSSAAPVMIAVDADRISLNAALEHYADPGGRREVAELARDANAFSPPGRDKLNYGFSADAHWLRISLANPSNMPVTRWLEVGHARLQTVRLFWREGGAWRELTTGTHVSKDSKPVVAATPVFPLTLAPHEERTLYLRVASETAITMDAALWDPLAFRAQETIYFMGQGAFLSALLLAGVFAFQIFLLMRNRVYILFGLALVFQTCFEGSMGGIIPRYIWPGSWPFTTPLVMVFSGLAVFFHTLFLCSFLNLRDTLPFWNRVFLVLAGVAVLCSLGGVFHSYRLWAQINTLNVVVVVVLAPVLSLVLLRRGYRSARFLLAGLSVLWISVFASQIMTLGFVPIWAPVQNSMPAATVLASSLILLAIADRNRELRDALARANASMEAKSTFLAHMSHELRTPLNTVIGFARLLRKGAPHVSPREGASAIERSGLHLLSMIDELLDQARSELGKLRLAPEPTPWNTFIDTISEAARVMTATAGNRFKVDVDGMLSGTVMIDARRLRQVLENLLANANRHTRAGAVTLACHIEHVAEAGNVRLHFRVIDTGEGVAPDDVALIFEPFQRGARKTTETGTQGTGLGLAISRQLVAQMGGMLRLEETSPKGSTFGFAIECAFLDASHALPTVYADSMQEGALASPFADASGVSPTPEGCVLPPGISAGKTLLVVEDLPESRALLSSMLREVGFDVIEAATGREALKLVGNNIDLVLTDQFMPDGDGWELLEGVRRHFPALPVILVSAADPNRPQGFPVGINFDAILGKPFDENQLFQRIGRLLAAKQSIVGEAETGSTGYVSPPARYRAELAKLVDEGRVTDIEEWAQALSANSPAWGNYANQVKRAVHRLDFEELARLASGQ